MTPVKLLHQLRDLEKSAPTTVSSVKLKGWWSRHGSVASYRYYTVSKN